MPRYPVPEVGGLLNASTDDFLTRSFSLSQLLARLGALAQRPVARVKGGVSRARDSARPKQPPRASRNGQNSTDALGKSFAGISHEQEWICGAPSQHGKNVDDGLSRKTGNRCGTDVLDEQKGAADRCSVFGE